ncbi:hypothetical protein HHK36_023955 [Tetracentron sinense]|uniref:Polygalacturonase n=1 Tax=Tetracentron sinense TaxID=13715 RepID=A0A835D5V8_TETSI|nr:hypothetical protein HHK36_023955 [Tetracentron sinense]
MGSSSIHGAICLLFLLAAVAEAQWHVWNVKKYGAKGDGQSDISQAMMSAWKEACASPSPAAVVIPPGNYMAGPVKFIGPCKAPMMVQVQGVVKAPADPNKFKQDGWVVFQYVDHLTVSGGGTFDGQGTTTWSKYSCGRTGKCPVLPINLRFDFVTNSVIRDIHSLNSKSFHVNVMGCKNVTFQHLTITAPENSPNTDGIHMGRATGINITDVKIGTGDDCISIGPGSRSVTINKVTCGPGHGISVGSLGRYQNEEDVVGINVRNCTLTNTMNGVRIKTWPASPNGFASDMHFDNIIMNKVSNPILIDQEYCPWNQCKQQVPSRVKISQVSFRNIRGTSATQLAVKLVCSKGMPCQNVEVGNINLQYIGKEGPVTSHCANVKPILTGKQIPAIV